MATSITDPEDAPTLNHLDIDVMPRSVLYDVNDVGTGMGVSGDAAQLVELGERLVALSDDHLDGENRETPIGERPHVVERVHCSYSSYQITRWSDGCTSITDPRAEETITKGHETMTRIGELLLEKFSPLA